MSSNYDIEMSLDDTLELDAIIQEWNSTGTVSIDRNDHSSTGIKTHTHIFNPDGTGEYEITVNGQTLLVNVTDQITITQPDSGVMRLDFENDVLDSWGDNNGEDNTGAGYSSDSQIGSYSKIFNETGTIKISHNSLQNQSSGSIGGWVKLDEIGSQRRTMLNKTQNTNSYYLEIDENKKASLFLSGVSDTTGNTTLSSSTYYHIVGTWSDGGNATVYVNGSSDGSTNIGSTNIGDTNPLYIGGNENDNHQLNGLLDDLRIYNKELIGSEVSNWYNTGNI